MQMQKLISGLGIVIAASAAVATAQQNPANIPTDRQSSTTSPLYWGVDTIMENYLKQMTRYYNLTKEQEEYTRALMNKRVKQFLNDYEKDVRWLAAEMFDYQVRREMPPTEIAREWGSRGTPLLNAIRQQVFDGNEEWRKVLNEEQRRQHDRDLEQMRKEFDRLEEKFQRWSSGDIRATDFPGAVSAQPRTVRRSEDAWQYYVRWFIQQYDLDEGQKQTAYSVLREMREEAVKYREAHKDEYARLEAAEAHVAASGPKTDPDELKRLKDENAKMAERRRELDRPISVGMFNRLKTHLEGIPTSDQRQAREGKLSRLAAMARRPATQPEVVASQPAADATPRTPVP